MAKSARDFALEVLVPLTTHPDGDTQTKKEPEKKAENKFCRKVIVDLR